MPKAKKRNAANVSEVLKLAKIQKELAESQKEIQLQQAHTDERLSALINVVEKVISEGNGHTSS